VKKSARGAKKTTQKKKTETVEEKTNYRPKKTVKTAKEHTPFRNQKTSPASKMNLLY
jgi:hypothetical protein